MRRSDAARAAHRVVDILQPDITWAGGISTCQRIAAIAGAAALSVMLHAGGNSAFGQHFSDATPSVPWLEFLPRAGVGQPLAATDLVVPGQPVPVDGDLTPSDAAQLRPGNFGNGNPALLRLPPPVARRLPTTAASTFGDHSPSPAPACAIPRPGDNASQ